MFRYRLHDADRNDLGEATYAVMIKPGEGDPARRVHDTRRPEASPRAFSLIRVGRC